MIFMLLVQPCLNTFINYYLIYQPTNFTKLLFYGCVNALTSISWSSTSLIGTAIIGSLNVARRRVSAYDTIQWVPFI